tara:strand:+ start:1297 stop:1515 length:219 start_codon:yes stop_codon:yes gene_type:complete
MTIKLENFTATIDVISVEVTSVNDNIKNKTASVNIIINGTHGGTLNGFTYTNTWDDSDIKNWVNLELEKYKI